MAPTPNIDAKGRLARLIWGIMLLAAAGLMVAFWAIPSGLWWAWAICVLVALAGVFAIYESRKGWCVMRAMGVKTPM
jgi:uncharacterized membrane protein YccC